MRPKTFVGVIAAAVLQHRSHKVHRDAQRERVVLAAVLNERRGLTPVVASQIAETLQAAVRRPSAGVRVDERSGLENRMGNGPRHSNTDLPSTHRAKRGTAASPSVRLCELCGFYVADFVKPPSNLLCPCVLAAEQAAHSRSGPRRRP
jgi:hypothetical protein